ncbi:hypothetical protein D3C71_1490790 [compost metagenome]
MRRKRNHRRFHRALGIHGRTCALEIPEQAGRQDHHQIEFVRLKGGCDLRHPLGDPRLGDDDIAAIRQPGDDARLTRSNLEVVDLGLRKTIQSANFERLDRQIEVLQHIVDNVCARRLPDAQEHYAMGRFRCFRDGRRRSVRMLRHGQ